MKNHLKYLWLWLLPIVCLCSKPRISDDQHFFVSALLNYSDTCLYGARTEKATLHVNFRVIIDPPENEISIRIPDCLNATIGIHELMGGTMSIVDSIQRGMSNGDITFEISRQCLAMHFTIPETVTVVSSQDTILNRGDSVLIQWNGKADYYCYSLVYTRTDTGTGAFSNTLIEDLLGAWKTVEKQIVIPRGVLTENGILDVIILPVNGPMLQTANEKANMVGNGTGFLYVLNSGKRMGKIYKLQIGSGTGGLPKSVVSIPCADNTYCNRLIQKVSSCIPKN